MPGREWDGSPRLAQRGSSECYRDGSGEWPTRLRRCLDLAPAALLRARDQGMRESARRVARIGLKLGFGQREPAGALNGTDGHKVRR